MKKQYNLIGYIDRADVDYGFLIPVYQNEDKNYFHQLSDDSRKITSFTAFNDRDYEQGSFKKISSVLQKQNRRPRNLNYNRRGFTDNSPDLEKTVSEEPTFIFKCFGRIAVGSVTDDNFKKAMAGCLQNPEVKNTFLKKEIYKLFAGDPVFDNLKAGKSSPSTTTLEISKSKAARRGFGRRREAIARVFISKGEGKIVINDKDYKTYFPLTYLQNQVERPLKAVDVLDKYDVKINAHGGGVKSQAETAMLGIARVLLEINPEFRSALKAAGVLVRDPRSAERKQFGVKKARKSYQFIKRR